MWLPTALYERIPKLWLVLGLLFIAYGLYLGLDLKASLASLIMGFVCWAYGIGIAVVRTLKRREESENDDSAATSE